MVLLIQNSRYRGSWKYRTLDVGFWEYGTLDRFCRVLLIQNTRYLGSWEYKILDRQSPTNLGHQIRHTQGSGNMEHQIHRLMRTQNTRYIGWDLKPRYNPTVDTEGTWEHKCVEIFCYGNLGTQALEKQAQGSGSGRTDLQIIY